MICATRTIMIASALLGFACAARAVTYQVPADSPPAVLSSGDAEVVLNNCSGCHSLDYIITQPRNKGPQFWRDEVNKMVNVYKAPVAPADVDAIVTVLTNKFG